MATATAAPPNAGKFSPGFQSEVIALKSMEGKPVSSRFNGPQVLFTLTDGRRFYADPAVAQKIEQLRIQPGEFFQVSKTVTRRGNQRIEQIEVEYLKEPADSPEKKPAGNQAGRGAGHASSLNNSNPTTPRPSAPAPATAAPPAPQPQLPQTPKTPVKTVAPMNGNGETCAEQLARCYRDAVDIASSAVEYAKGSGLVIAPAFCDIRALAATIAIAEGGRR